MNWEIGIDMWTAMCKTDHSWEPTVYHRELNSVFCDELVRCDVAGNWEEGQRGRFSSVTQSCPTLCYQMDCSMPGFHVHHGLLVLAQTHVHWVGDAIQSFHPLLSPSPPAFNFSQHQGLFQSVSSSHQVAKALELQFQYQSFQRIFRTDFL